MPASIIFFVILVLCYLIYQTRRPRKYPPGPTWLPIVGNLPELKKISALLGGQQHALLALAKKYNTNVLGMKLGSELVVAVFSYPIIKEVLTRDEYLGRPNNFFLRLRCMGKRRGITCTDGKIWSSQRNFVNRHLKNLGFGKKPMDQMIQDEVTSLLQSLDSDGCNVNINSLIAPSVLNVIWTLVTGERISKDSNQLEEFLELFSLRRKAFDMTGGTLSQHPWLRHILPEWSGYNLIQTLNSRMKDFLLKTILKHKESWTEGKDDDLIYRYLNEMNSKVDDTQHFDDDQLIMICLDLFIGGAQTTSATLDFAFSYMIMNPDIQTKIQFLLDKNFKKDIRITYAERSKVPYVEAVLLETMRMRTAGPVIGPRRVLENTVLDGYILPKDTTVLVSLNSIHDNSKYWKDPDQFNPDRFLNDDGLLIANEKLIPFGLGRRRCIGDVLAKNCLFVCFAEILRRFTVSLGSDSKPLSGKYLSGITLSPEPYTANFIKREYVVSDN